MTHYSVVSVTPSRTDWIEPYLDRVTPLVQRHGGRYLARTASHGLLEGEGAPALQVILEWPSEEAERSFHADVDYARWLEARLAGSESRWASIAGKDDFAR